MALAVGTRTRHAEVLAAALAMTAGYVDAYGLITYQTYLSFMSGNTTQTGSQLGQGHLGLAIPAFIAIVSFITGVFAGTILAQIQGWQAQWKRLFLVVTLLAVTSGLMATDAIVPDLAIAILALAMGILNTVLSHVGAQSVNIGFVSGTLNTAGQHLALALLRAPLPGAEGTRDTHIRRAILLLGLWLAFISGACIAGFATSRLQAWVLAPPCLALGTLAFVGTELFAGNDTH